MALITVSADKTDIFTLGAKGAKYTAGTDYQHIPGLTEVLQIAKSLDGNCSDTTAKSISNESNEAYWNQKA